jgi:hypothetical protein
MCAPAPPMQPLVHNVGNRRIFGPWGAGIDSGGNA